MNKYLAHADPPFLAKITLTSLGRVQPNDPAETGGPFIPAVQGILIGSPHTTRWMPGLISADDPDWPLFDTEAEAIAWLVGKAAENASAARAALNTAEAIHAGMLKRYQAMQRQAEADSLSA